MIRLLATLALLLPSVALVTPSSARAQEEGAAPRDPWSAEVAVSDRGEDERREAWTLALREVLLANSGDKTLLNRDEVRDGLRDAESYVERFDYRTPPPGTLIPRRTPLTDAVRESGEATQLMVVRFARDRLEALIARETEESEATEADAEEASADPFANVGAALLWLLIEDGRREILVSDPAARNVRARAREIAGARGLRLRYPVGDDEDRAMLDAEDIREERLERARLASERYAVPEGASGAAPVVLVGHLARDGLSAWQGRWTKFAGEALERESFASDTLDEALQAGLGWLSASGDDDAYRYGGAAGSDTEALVWIGPLDSVTAYATVMNFLQEVEGVGTVYPKEIDERGMAFTVIPRGALPAIADAARSQSWLRRTQPPRDAGRFEGRGVGAGDERDRPVVDARTEARTAAASGEGVGTGERDTRESASRRGGSLARNAELAFDYLR